MAQLPDILVHKREEKYNNTYKLFYTWIFKMKIIEFENSVDPDETAHNELPHLDILFLPSLIWIFP